MNRIAILLLFALLINCGPEIKTYDGERYGLVTNGVILRKEFEKNSERLRELTKGSIVILLGEVHKKPENNEKVTWYKIKSRSGFTGYAFGDYIKPLSLDIGKNELMLKQNKFEIRLKKTIIEYAKERIDSSNQFPLDDVTDLRIISPLEPTSSSSYDVLVTSWLKGSLLGIDTTSVTVNVNLYLNIDYDNLPNSIIKVNHVDILKIEKTEGIDPGKTVDLLVKIL
ncbi:hypothetical protein LEP1GSC088_0710 [Leptospira interrogans str. L1207]|nr:hypothetical protein LEP1GSC088_0710 [Leptospira interrogans str. L1207]